MIYKVLEKFTKSLHGGTGSRGVIGGACSLNIESLLKHIHPLVKKSFADFAKAAKVYFNEQMDQADAEQKKELQPVIESFDRVAKDMDKVVMASLQTQLTELSGATLDAISSEYAVNLTADDLSLVEEDDLEQQVALETIAHKGLNQVSLELNLFNQRLNKAFKREDVDDRSNPLGPYMFSESVGQACRKINASIPQKIQLFRVYENSGFKALNNIISNANQYLKSQGILPNAEIQHKSTLRDGASGDAGPAAEGGAVEQVAAGGADLSQAPVVGNPDHMVNISDPAVKKVFDMLEKDGYGVLQKLMESSNDGPETRISSAGLSDQNFAEKKEIQDEDLVGILDELQAQNIREEDIPILEGEFQKKTMAENIGGALQVKSEELGAETTLAKSGNDVVNLVDMLFDFILSDDYLSDGVKAIISELQVPLTKVALLDQTFFSDNQHPARQLLNELSRSGMAVERSGNLLADKTVKTISGTVKQVNENFQQETSVFEEALGGFSVALEKQEKKTQVLEQRLLDAEKGRAKAEHADEMVDKLYTGLRARVPSSKALDEFLDSGWRDVLTMTCLRFGSHSKQWKADNEVTKKLMKSILLAKRARLNGKRMKIPMELLNLLKKALDRISYDPLETKRLLSNLAKTYQKIGATSAEEIEAELIDFGGQAAAMARVKTAVAEKGATETPNESPAEQGVEEQANQAEAATVDGEIEEEISKEREKIAAAPEEAIKETLDSLDGDIVEEVIQQEEAVEAEFAPGDTWYDMASELAIGTWVELPQVGSDQALRCKLVANIKTLEKLIFANKAGAKVAERKVVELAAELKEKSSKVVNENTIFDQALENVIVNLREQGS